MLYMWLTSF